MQITGRSNINQLLESLRVYTKRRPAYTSDALSDLYTQLKEGPRNQIKDYRYIFDVSIHIHGLVLNVLLKNVTLNLHAYEIGVNSRASSRLYKS